MKKTLLCGLLAAASLGQSAQAARTVPVHVDGQLLEADCYIDQGVTYVPFRSLLDTLGGWEVYWDHAQDAAVAVSGETALLASPATNTLRAGSASLDGTVYVVDGCTYVPLRPAAALLGGSVAWDPYLGGAVMTSHASDYNASDLYWLSRIINAESEGEPIEGQIAVGNVVMGRVESEDFPDTIPDVIFDVNSGVYQFEPVENGRVYLEPTAQSVEAAMRVLDGEETVDGALFFYAPALSPGTWINENRTYLTTIGCHRFYR